MTTNGNKPSAALAKKKKKKKKPLAQSNVPHWVQLNNTNNSAFRPSTKRKR